MQYMLKASEFLNKQDKILFFLLKTSLLLVFLHSMNAWFLWKITPAIAGAISFVFCFLYLITRPSLFSTRQIFILSIFILVIVRLYVIRDANINAYIEVFIRSSPLALIILLAYEKKIELLRFITSTLGLLLFVSLLAWICFLAGCNLPHSSIEYNNGQYWFDNYYLFIHDLNPYFVIPRFSSVFLEPGHLGMITSFLLFANRFELKRIEVIILLIATLFTFSLAAYILLFISVMFFLLVRTKKPLIYLSLFVVFLLIGYQFFSQYNNGNNIVNNLIIERLRIEDQSLAGDTRYSELMDSYYNEFIYSDKVFTGIGFNKYEKLNLGANAGYKVFIVQNGILGTLLLIFLYISFILYHPSIEIILLLLVYALSFLQRAYALWECELIIFILAVAMYKTKEIKQHYAYG